MPGRKGNTITTELENSPKPSCKVLYLNREAAMLEGVVSCNTTLLKVMLLMTGSLIRQKVHFFTLNGITGSMASPRRAPILLTKSVTKTQINKCTAEIQDLDRICSRDAWTKSKYHNHWAKKNSLQMQLLGTVFKSGSSHAWSSGLQ